LFRIYKDGLFLGIGIYGHWSGQEMASAAIEVINNPAFSKRIGDSSYATRIGVQTALEKLGAKSNEEGGFGLWTMETGPVSSGNYNVVVIDVMNGEIHVTGQHSFDCTNLDTLISDPTVSNISTRMLDEKMQTHF
jgi:hypothetical protein